MVITVFLEFVTRPFECLLDSVPHDPDAPPAAQVDGQWVDESEGGVFEVTDHSFSWPVARGSEHCTVSLTVENVGDDARNINIQVRILDENGTRVGLGETANGLQPGESKSFEVESRDCQKATSYEIVVKWREQPI